ncbi:MAG: phosphate ABC transporter substrate-binding protein PstS [Acidobacteriota bacterium]
MRRSRAAWSVAVLVGAVLLSAWASGTFSGAGATFPYPLYARWAHAYRALTGSAFNYQSIGSGGGILQVQRGTVDYGASEYPLTPQDLNRFGLIQFPMVVGVVVPVVNLPGTDPSPLRLTPELLADLFLGRVVRWNDPRILALNPGRDLPGLAVGIVGRADGSGTTWLFTRYLSRIHPGFASRVGVGPSVKWPSGIAAKGNEGVASYVREVPGALGYVEYAYAVQSGLRVVALETPGGTFAEPNRASIRTALDREDWALGPGLELDLMDSPEPGGWPILGASYILLPREHKNPSKGRALLDYFDWCLREGAKAAEELHYFPLPPVVVNRVETHWKENVRSGGRAVWP